MAQQSESRALDKVIVRLPDGMRDQLKAAAEKNSRSMNAEIVARLEEFVRLKTRVFALGRENDYLSDEKERLESELLRLAELKNRFFDKEGIQAAVLAIPPSLLDRIKIKSEQNHRSVDAEAVSALEKAFPPESIDVELLSVFLQSLIGVSAPDGDKGYLEHINDSLAKAKQPWTVEAGWDGMIRFYPYATPREEPGGEEPEVNDR